jgi:hypothetical protein
MNVFTTTDRKMVVLEKGLNRSKPNEIEQDNINQSKARFDLMQFLGVDIETQDIMSFWDWEFYRDDKLIAIGEYRRRFCNFGTYEDFQFSKKKFNAMVDKGKKHGIPAYMFVEFDDLFLYFLLDGLPPSKIMKRNHEIRTEECVCITNDLFQSLYKLEI